jgi:UDP-N-acetylglucosamine acyltransferase
MAEIKIHPTAIIDPKAELDSSVEVDAYAIIENNVQIDAGCVIGPRALIASGARLDKNVKIHHCATVSTIPQDLKFGGEESILKIGENTIIREYATLNRGTEWSGESAVGKNCLLMAYTHIPHDAQVGDNVIIANSVQMGGHVVIGDYVVLGGGSVVHQFTKIGAHAMIGGGMRIVQDVCPFAVVGTIPATIGGVNVIGLKRRGYKLSQIKLIKEAFKYLFQSGMNTTQAIEKIKSELEQIDEIKLIVDFVENSERGLIK